MAVSGVEHAAFTMLLHPRPRLTMICLNTLHQYCSIICQLVMYIGLIPGRKCIQRMRYGVLLVHDRSDKRAGVVFLKLTSDEADIFRRILKAEACGMHGDKPFSLFNKI